MNANQQDIGKRQHYYWLARKYADERDIKRV
jgi:hypothetical protein